MKNLMLFVVLMVLVFVGFSIYEMNGLVVDHAILAITGCVCLMFGLYAGRSPYPIGGTKKAKKAPTKKGKGRATA